MIPWPPSFVVMQTSPISLLEPSRLYMSSVPVTTSATNCFLLISPTRRVVPIYREQDSFVASLGSRFRRDYSD